MAGPMNAEFQENGAADQGRWRMIAAAVGLGLVTVALAFAWLYARSAAATAEERAKREEEKLEKVKRYLEENYTSIFGGQDRAQDSSPLKEQSFLAIVKQLCEECGVSDKLLRVTEEENRKTGELTAKVGFRSMRMADLVNFLALARRTWPGITDREARLRQGRGEADSWEVTVSLTAKKP